MSTSIYASVYWALFSGSVSTLSPPASLSPPLNGFQPSSIPRGLLAQAATASHSQEGMPGLSGSSGSVAESATRFLGCLALVPAGINLVASAFVNHVPIDYHGLEQLPYESEQQHATPHKPLLSATLWWCLGLVRVQKSTRFTGMYCLVGLLVVFQAGAALHKGTHQEGREVQKAQMAVLLGMLSLLLLLPLSTGPVAVKSLRRAMRMGLHHNRHSSGHALPHHLAPLLPGTQPPRPDHALPSVAPTLHHPSSGCSGNSSRDGTGSTALGGDLCQDHGSTGALLAVAPHPSPAAAAADGADRAEIGYGSEEGQGLLVGSQQQGFLGSRGGVRGRHCVSACPGVLDGGVAEEEQATGREEGQGDDTAQRDKDAVPLEDVPLGKALCQLSFAVLFLQFLSACASGLTYLNNLAALVTSIGGPVGGQVVFVSLFSIANACGRLLFGHVSEHYLHTMGVPRTAFLALAAVLSLSGSAALAAGAPLSSLYAVSLLMGFAFGGHWSVVPAVASDLYGLSSFAALYAVLQLASALAAFVFASWLAGHFAAAAAAAAAAATAAVANTPLPPPLSVAIASKVGTLPARGRALAASAAAAAGPLAGAAGREEGLECMGYECYTPTFRVLVLLHVLSLCGVVWMMQSTKAQYAVIVAGRKQQQLQQQQQQHPDG